VLRADAAQKASLAKVQAAQGGIPAEILPLGHLHLLPGINRGQTKVLRFLSTNSSTVIGWLKKLRDDRRLVIHAAAEAQHAADYIGLEHHSLNCSRRLRRRASARF